MRRSRSVIPAALETGAELNLHPSNETKMNSNGCQSQKMTAGHGETFALISCRHADSSEKASFAFPCYQSCTSSSSCVA